VAEQPDLALAVYAHEPCRVCGRLIGLGEVAAAVFAGYSACGTSRAAHGPCWRGRPPKPEWAYPEDAARP
jgi:hypothetical protein